MNEEPKFKIFANGEFEVCSNAIEIAGMKLTPDPTKAYVEFFLSFGFPSVTVHGLAHHPQVVANSYRSMLHQMFDFGHYVRAFDKENIAKDRILGSVVAVEFPNAPAGGWKIPATVEEAPCIRGAAVLHKLADGADKILGQELGGRTKRTVSMEVIAMVDNGGFLVKSDNELPDGLGAGTPEDLRKHGCWYVSAADAPEALIECWRPGGKGIVSRWKGKEVIFLNGGIDGEVHYMGVGMVDRGKEPPARIDAILAGDTDETPNDDGLLDILKDFQKINRKPVDVFSEICSRSDIRQASS